MVHNAEELGLSQDSDVDVLCGRNEVAIELVSPQRCSIADLLAEVTDANRHHEVETFSPVGDEAW